MRWRFAAALLGLGLAIASGVVTAIGQMATEGGLLLGFAVVETIVLLALAGTTLTLRSTRRSRLVAGAYLAIALGLGLLVVAVGEGAELASGLAPAWLWVGCPLDAGSAAAFLVAATLTLRNDRRPRTEA